MKITKVVKIEIEPEEYDTFISVCDLARRRLDNCTGPVEFSERQLCQIRTFITRAFDS